MHNIFRCHSFSKHAHCDRFLIWHFMRISNTSRNHWRLQHYHKPNDSPTTKVASFHVNSSKRVIIYKLRSKIKLTSSHYHLRMHLLTQQKYKTTCTSYIHVPNLHYTTNDAAFYRSRNKTNNDVWSAVHAVQIIYSSRCYCTANSVFGAIYNYTKAIRNYGLTSYVV